MKESPIEVVLLKKPVKSRKGGVLPLLKIKFLTLPLLESVQRVVPSTIIEVNDCFNVILLVSMLLVYTKH